MQLPTYKVPIDTFPKRPVQWGLFGSLREAKSIIIDKRIPGTAREWILVYEELIRRFYPECRRWIDEINMESDGSVSLNTIEPPTSQLLLEYLRNPKASSLQQLFDIIRFHRGSPDVIALIVARNEGWTASRLVEDSAVNNFWSIRFRELYQPMEMPTRISRRTTAQANNAFYVLVDINNRSHLVFGQATSTTPAVIRDLLGDKHMTASLLKSAGFSVPQSVPVNDPEVTLSAIALFPADASVIVKPINDSNRVGVIGPISVSDPNLVKKAVERCLTQVSNGPRAAIIEEYIQGIHHRINVNHGKVTFVAKSIPCTITGDGRHTIRELLNKRRNDLGYNFRSADIFFENALYGTGFDLDSVPPTGKKLQLSHDGNEEGFFEDVTESFEESIKEEALLLSEYLGCPVLGLDVILDSEGRAWIVDVNSNPGIDFFGNTQRAYETMEHMLKSVATKPDTGMKRTPLSFRR